MDNKQFVETPLQSKKEVNTMDSQKKKTSQKGEQQPNQKKNLKNKEKSSATKTGVARTKKPTPNSGEQPTTDRPTKQNRKGHPSSITATQTATKELIVDKRREATRSEQRRQNLVLDS